MNTTPMLIDTGSELLSGYSIHKAQEKWQGLRHNWNLLLVTRGSGGLQFEKKHCLLPAHSLTMLSPGGPRSFITREPWECYWVHFDRNLYLDQNIEWNESANCIRTVQLETVRYRRILSLFLQLAQTAELRERGWHRLAYCLIQEIILRAATAASAARSTSSYDTELARRLLTNLKDNFTMDEIARQCGLSRSAFFARFTETFGISPRQYREQHLMRTVQAMLENSDLSIREITEHVHISTPFYLSCRFKLCYGCSPRDYRRRIRYPEKTGNQQK